MSDHSQQASAETESAAEKKAKIQAEWDRERERRAEKRRRKVEAGQQQVRPNAPPQSQEEFDAQWAEIKRRHKERQKLEARREQAIQRDKEREEQARHRAREEAEESFARFAREAGEAFARVWEAFQRQQGSGSSGPTFFTFAVHEPWHQILGVKADAPEQEVKSAYRQLVMQHHPDRGGDPQQFIRVQEAWEAYARARGTNGPR